MTDQLPIRQARALALRAQGLIAARPDRVTSRHLRREISRMGVLQIDSVNVYARSHYLPLWARVGDVDDAVADDLLLKRPRRSDSSSFVEYIAHEATFLPSSDLPLWAFRRDAMRAKYAGAGTWAHDKRDLFARVVDELRDRGPLRPSEFVGQDARARRGAWWGWDDLKQALELMWRFGDVVVAGRQGFERRYALPEQVLPAAVVGNDIARADAIAVLVERASRSLGVAAAADIADYYRVNDRRAIHEAIDQLVEDGVLAPVSVEGWTQNDRPLPAWRHTSIAVPRAADTEAVLSPFDPLVWFRPRAARLFDFDYRIEIYTPLEKRKFGYYSLPVLVGDTIVARIDLKADRAAGTLLVQSAWWEGSRPTRDTVDRVAELLRTAARRRALETLSVSHWGDAASDVAAALGCGRHDHPRAPVPSLTANPDTLP